MFLSAGIFSEITTQRNSEKQKYLHAQEFSREYMTKVLHSKRVVSSVYSKSGKKEDFAERNSSIDLSLQRHALTEFFHNRYSFKDFTKFTGKYLYHILYLIKLQLSSLQLYSVPSAGVFL